MEITIQKILYQLNHQFEAHSDTAKLDAQVLVAHHLGKPRSWVLSHPEAVLSTGEYENILQSSRRLQAGEPLPYVLGHWEFYRLDFLLSPKVLIPRPETELLVERAISWLQLNPHKRKVVDVGTGSGCIGIAIASHIPDVEGLLIDISARALDVARFNVAKHALQDRLQLQQANLLNNIPASFDLICANLPYIPTQALAALPVARSEPRTALDGGLRGLKVIKRLVKEAASKLNEGGLILLEIDPGQREMLLQLAGKQFPGAKVSIFQDLSGKDRCVAIEQRYLIYHLCQRQDWLKSQASRAYQADSLEHEGFIHCSKIDQVIGVANRYYQGVPQMVMLTIDPQKLTSIIHWEISGNEYYPHVFGPINVDAVIQVVDVRPESDGVYRCITTQEW